MVNGKEWRVSRFYGGWEYWVTKADAEWFAWHRPEGKVGLKTKILFTNHVNVLEEF